MHDLMDYARQHDVEFRPVKYHHGQSANEKYVGYDQVVRALNNLSDVLGDHCLGLHVAEQISLKATAQVTGIMLSSQTLKESIENAIHYSKLISDALECSLDSTPDHYSIVYEENPNWKVQHGNAKKQILDMALLSNVKSLGAYANYQYFPVKVHFTYDKPRHLNEYFRLFNCSLRFNQPRSEIIYEKQVIDRHSRAIAKGLLENLMEKVAHEIDALPAEDKLVNQLKKCILNYKPERLMVDEAASQLHMSGRTLQRKLKARDTNFKQVEHELQINLAKSYLDEGQKSIDEISYLLGFAEGSAFIRFFKTATSQTPGSYKLGSP